MALPDGFLDQLRDATNLVDVISEKVSLKKQGNNFVGLCPFHQEKTPSFSVSLEKQYYHCFGCGASGNAITFLRQTSGMDFMQAVENLATRAGMPMPKSSNTRANTYAPLYELMQQASQHYHGCLMEKHPTAQQPLKYLSQRGYQQQTINRFKLGLATSHRSFLEAYKPSSSERNQLLQCGLAREKKESKELRDYFWHHIMFPIRNTQGKTIAFGGRALGNTSPKYLNSPETPIFKKSRTLYGLYEALQQNHKPDKFFVVEGYTDVLALSQATIYETVASLGTALSEEHLKLLFSRSNEILICMDGDEAGHKASVRVLTLALPLMEDGRVVKFIQMPEGCDPADFAKQHPNDIRQRLENLAVPLSQFLIHHCRQGLDLQTVEEAALFCQKSMELVNLIPRNIYYARLCKEISSLAGVSVDDVIKIKSGKRSATYTPKSQTNFANADKKTPLVASQTKTSKPDNRNTTPATNNAPTPQLVPNQQEKELLRSLLKHPQLVTSFPTDWQELARSNHFNLLLLLVEKLTYHAKNNDQNYSKILADTYNELWGSEALACLETIGAPEFDLSEEKANKTIKEIWQILTKRYHQNVKASTLVDMIDKASATEHSEQYG